MPKPMKKIDKAKDFGGTIKKILSYIKKYRFQVIIAMTFTVLSTIFSIIGPNILGDVTTEIYTGIVKKITNTGGIDFTFVSKTLLILLILYIASALFSYIESYILNSISCKISYNLRNQISEKFHRLPISYYEKNTNGEILSRITNDVDTFAQNLSQTLSQLLSSVITIIGTIIMMITISPNMTVASLLILPISLFGMSIIMSKSQKYFTRQQQDLGDTNSLVEETYAGHDVINAFNKEEDTINAFKELNDKLYESGWKSQFISSSMHPLMSFVGNINYVLVSIYGGYLTIQNKIQVGSILSFSQYIRTLNSSISSLAQISSLLQPTVASAERVFELLEEQEEKDINIKVKDTSNIKGNITFKNVEFGYNKNQIIINNFNANIKKGQKIAIVGPTGAGKTTMVKLLMRFYDVNKGEILIDGINIKDFKRSDLRNLFGMVLQDTWLFNGTILDNIKYGKQTSTKDEIITASKNASVHHFIETLPDNYNTYINEETDNISQGQKQLLTIARVILKDPKILILDEATSSVDTRTEILIQNAMDKLMENRTSFIIAHRLSTIRNADLILVMDKGDIVEQGTHEELLKKNGFYAKLYNSQFEEV